MLFPVRWSSVVSKSKPKSAPAVVSCLHVLYMHMCFAASESFYSTCQGRRLTSVIQTANLSKSVSPAVPTRADWFVSTNSRACFTAILVCICVSAISVALFLHAAAYFYTGYVIIHASNGEFEGSS